MTRNGTQTMLKTLGIISIVLSMICICVNFFSFIQLAMMSSMTPMMEEFEHSAQVDQEKQIADLEKQKEETEDEQEGERLDREIEALKAAPEIMNPFAIMKDPKIKIYSILDTSVALVSNILLAIGGIGLLLLANWGRKISLLAAILKILATIASQVYNIFVIMPMMSTMMQEIMNSAPSGSGGAPSAKLMSSMMGIGSTVGAVVTFFIIAIYPIVLLVLLNLKDSKLLLSGQWPKTEIPAGEEDLAPRNIRNY